MAASFSKFCLAVAMTSKDLARWLGYHPQQQRLFSHPLRVVNRWGYNNVDTFPICTLRTIPLLSEFSPPLLAPRSHPTCNESLVALKTTVVHKSFSSLCVWRERQVHSNIDVSDARPKSTSSFQACLGSSYGSFPFISSSFSTSPLSVNQWFLVALQNSALIYSPFSHYLQCRHKFVHALSYKMADAYFQWCHCKGTIAQSHRRNKHTSSWPHCTLCQIMSCWLIKGFPLNKFGCQVCVGSPWEKRLLLEDYWCPKAS